MTLQEAADRFEIHSKTCPLCQTALGLCADGAILMGIFFDVLNPIPPCLVIGKRFSGKADTGQRRRSTDA